MPFINQPKEVPKLITLAAQVLYEHKPHLFFFLQE